MPSRTFAAPRCSISSPSRRRPIVTAASWARRSPSLSRGERTFARRSAEERLVDDAFAHDPDRRDDQPLLDLLAPEADAAGRPAADVHVMRHRHGVRERLAVHDQRRDEADVVEVQPAEVAVVAEDRVARAQVRRAVGLDDGGHEARDRAQVDRLGEALGDRPRPAVEERAGEVEPRLDVGRVGGTAERGAHLVRDAGERVTEDLEREGRRVRRRPFCIAQREFTLRCGHARRRPPDARRERGTGRRRHRRDLHRRRVRRRIGRAGDCARSPRRRRTSGARWPTSSSDLHADGGGRARDRGHPRHDGRDERDPRTARRPDRAADDRRVPRRPRAAPRPGARAVRARSTSRRRRWSSAAGGSRSHERIGPDGRGARSRSTRPPSGGWSAFIEAEGIEAVAVCLLHSFRNPAHEQAVGRAVAASVAYTSLSVDLLPVIGEYERTSTTVVNAYIGPLVSRYLLELADRAAPDRRDRAAPGDAVERRVDVGGAGSPPAGPDRRIRAGRRASSPASASARRRACAT